MKPKHKKSHFFYTKDLFADLSAFTELENRIHKLPVNERGDAFEVFAEAYFNTQKIHQAKEVWPDNEVPQSLRNQLGLPSTDKGIDGVFKSYDDQYHAYQVKYRSHRSSLAWEELSTFMGLSDKSDQRVLFTNSNDISSVMNARTDFYSIKGNDLDKLEQADFKAIENWFNSGLVSREKKSPRPHQSEAISDILEEFKANDRATVIMACATGKTLVALWVAEKKDAQTVLVLLPSLALVRQTLHDWAKENSWDDFNYLCVCSDATVIKGIDETVLRQHDLDFPVTTQREVVQQFLNNKNSSRKIIFSTYQSCQIVAEAMPKSFSFDLAIFDEAHKTASRQGANYAFALQDHNLPIKKRLFLTATPRHYNVNKRDKEGEQRLVYSMDDETTYGRKAHQLSFRGAIEGDLICDYKVIVSVVTSEMVNRELLRRGKVIVDGDIIRAQRIANILALQKAIDEYGAKKIFSFHNSVPAAKSFTSNKNEGIGAYLKDFASLHVNGEMSTSVRDNLLKEFKESDKAIISNARCLTEGVNVPAVDMVAFISPKKSKVDIVQAAGRAMRKFPGKEFGYILIPLFMNLAEDEKPEEAVEKTNFQDIWDVLQAIQEQDESLVEIIAQMREYRGKALGFNDNRLREKVEILGPELCINELRKSINTKIIDRLGSNWDEMFGELIRFKAENGHCNVSKPYPPNLQLGIWVNNQRRKYRKGELSLEKIEKLEDIGFEWDIRDAQWEGNYRLLCEFKQVYGYCNVPQRCKKDLSLGSWVARQCTRYANKKLSPIQIRKLKKIGFIFNPRDAKWEEKCRFLYEFKKIYDHCNVPRNYNKSLSIWVTEQRSNKGSLSNERVAKLNDIGFEWITQKEKNKQSWIKQFNYLREFKQKYNRWPKDKEIYPANNNLGSWCDKQRQAFKGKRGKNGLEEWQIELLEGMHFEWEPDRESWIRQYNYTKSFVRINHRLPRQKENYPAENKLGLWVQNQRQALRKQKGRKPLVPWKISMLNEIGII